MTQPQWFLIETEQEYESALARYEEVKRAQKILLITRKKSFWYISFQNTKRKTGTCRRLIPLN